MQKWAHLNPGLIEKLLIARDPPAKFQADPSNFLFYKVLLLLSFPIIPPT
jgi:hypothetical protein